MAVFLFYLNFAICSIGLIRATLWKFGGFGELLHHDVELGESLVTQVKR